MWLWSIDPSEEGRIFLCSYSSALAVAILYLLIKTHTEDAYTHTHSHAHMLKHKCHPAGDGSDFILLP